MKKPRRIIIQNKGSRELVLHSQAEAIRGFHIRAYQAQLASLKVATEKMRYFTEVDQPAFTLWWQQEFADELIKQMQLEQTLGDLQMLTDAVEQYKAHYGCTHQRAFNIVSKAQADGTLSALMQKIFAEIDRVHEKVKTKKPRIEVEDFAHERSEPFKSEQQPSRDAASAGQPIASVSPEETSDHYIKRIYRDLVRLLHPDAKSGGEQTAEEKVLWHELQKAYQWGDLNRMEGIYKTVNGQTTSAIDFATIPIGDIYAMKEAVARKLNDMRTQLKMAKKEANWDFENRRKKRSYLNYMFRSIQSELVEQTMLLENHIEKLKRRVQSWTAARKNQKQKSSRREQADDNWAY